MNLVEFIRQNTDLKEKQVDTVVSLLDEGNTIPFIARYRKDKTDNLDEVGVKTVKDKLEYFREIQDRKQTVINTITELGKMTDELMNKITNTFDKLQLEDLYAPYKPKKTTRAAKAKEAGLEKLTGIILNPALRAGNIEEIVTPFINAEKGYDTVEKTINGACDIIAENIADNADIKGFIRNSMLNFGNLSSKVKKGKEEEGAKYQNYFEFSEKVKYIPSHRILAIFRGENEKILSVSVDGDDEKFVEYIKRNNKNFSPLFSEYVNNAMEDSYKRLIKPSISNEIRKILKERADFESVKVFSDNLRALLMSAPLGTKKVLAVDPGIRTGAKLAVISETGDFLEHTVLYWNTNNPAEEKKVLGLISKYEITHIGVGNGTGGRELREYFLQSFKKNNMKNMNVIMVNESGASIYSASDSAREEFGELDLTVRGAISIGRRLQDPLAELVKITPESIGVGQYQHDVDNSLLKKELKETVEFCVNKVGVNLNTASKELLSYVSGVSAKIAKNIIEYREKNGMFKSRKEIKKVTGLGPKAFEQAAGFMRISGENPLENTGVHPDHYYIVDNICKKLKLKIDEIVKKPDYLTEVNVEEFVDENAGKLTLTDIFEEIRKPGLDPREKFEIVSFDENVKEIDDVIPGQVLNGIITNITKFGAFCDIGVHQDGLIHISQIADKFIKDPSEVVSVGQWVKVKVVEVDKQRRRIALTMLI